MKFADPKNDLAFKKIFGDENKKEILISFLNSVLDFKDGKTIVDVSVANPYQVPKIPELKDTILDIKATNQNGDKFIVEMQKKNLGDFDKRSLYYTAKAYIEQLDSSQDYTRLKKVYFIGILDFNIFKNQEYISRHLIINQQTNTQDIKDFEFSFIELKKFDKTLSQLSTTLDKWIYFVKNATSLDLVPNELQDVTELQEAFVIANQTTWNKRELEIYDDIALKIIDDKNAIDTAKEQGIEQGIEQRNLEIAKNLLDILDNKTISLKTGLSIQQIENLRE